MTDLVLGILAHAVDLAIQILRQGHEDAAEIEGKIRVEIERLYGELGTRSAAEARELGEG